MVPLTVDGLIYASSMLDSARRKTPVPALARWLLGLGIAATLAANVVHGATQAEYSLLRDAVVVYDESAITGKSTQIRVPLHGCGTARIGRR